jgi:hypothetical protein
VRDRFCADDNGLFYDWDNKKEGMKEGDQLQLPPPELPHGTIIKELLSFDLPFPRLVHGLGWFWVQPQKKYKYLTATIW